jgi:hypothetical protein
VYKVSVAGKIGGASGPTVEIGDTIYCSADTVAGTHAAVGSKWDILQVDFETLAASRIESLELGTATYDDLQDYINVTQSGGRISGGVLSAHSPANGTVDVSALKGFIKTTDSDIAETRFFDLAAAASVALTDNATNYIYVDYNAGTPRILVATDRTTIKLTNQFTLGQAFRAGNDVEVLQSGINTFNRTRKTHERWIDTFGGISYASGINVSATGLKPAITAGILYAGSNKILIDAKDCNTSGTFDSYYWNPTTSAWVITTGQTAIDVTNYNKTDTGTGLAALTANKYGVHWLYVCPDGYLYVLYGKGDYTLTQAQAATVATPIPNYISQWAKLAAKIIIQKSATSLYSITMAWSTQFPVQTPGDHNALAGLQGGTTDQYYHLTDAQNTQISGVGIASGTLATQFIYVDKAATGTGTGVNWTNAFTTIQAAVDSLPAVIAHAVTIYVRKGSTAYDETVTIQRLVGAGLITLQGEYYTNNTAVAANGTGNGKFGLNAADTWVAAGDIVYLSKASAYDIILDTVASVDGSEVTLTTSTATITTDYRYVIVRTVINAVSATSTTNLTVSGLNITTTGTCVSITGCTVYNVTSCIVESTAGTGIAISGGSGTITGGLVYYGGGSTQSCVQVLYNAYVVLNRVGVFTNALTTSTGRCSLLVGYESAVNLNTGCTIKHGASSTAFAIKASGNSYVSLNIVYIDGTSGSSIPTALWAIGGATITYISLTLGSNITTAKDPANWAATTDGSYIQ